jgi:hypothetical protein
MAKKFLTPIGLPAGTSFPATAEEGELFYRSDEDNIYTYNGSSWTPQRSLDINEALIELGMLEEAGGANTINGGTPSTQYGATLSGGGPDSF